MSFTTDAEIATGGLVWLKTPTSIQKDLIEEIGELDSSKIIFDFSKYNFSSKIQLTKISRGIHSKVFNDFIMSYVKTGRYPVLVKDILTGKQIVSKKYIRKISLKVSSDQRLLKDYIVYSLVKELEAASEISKQDRISESRGTQIEAMTQCFDAILKNIFSEVDSQMKERLLRIIQTDRDIVNLVKIHPKKVQLNAVYIIFYFAAVFIALYSTAFFFIDTNASLLAIKNVLSL